MVSKHENKYDIIKPDNSSATAKLRYGCGDPDSPTEPRVPLTGISTRTWSPGQAALFRRKKVEGESEAALTDSFGALSMSDVQYDADQEEEDYLTQKLNSIEKSDFAGKSTTKGKRYGRLPTVPIKSKSPSKPKPTTWERSRDVTPLAVIRKPSITKTKTQSTRVRRAPLAGYSSNSGSQSDQSVGSDISRGKSSPHRHRSSRRDASRSKSPSHQKYSERGRRKMRTKSRDRSIKSRDKSRPKLDQKDLPIEIQRKLYRVTDPNISIKKKVELELEFMKGTPEEKRMYIEFRNHFDRKGFLDGKALDELQKRDSIEANAREESLKEAAFLRTVDRKHQKERKLEEDAQERERKAIESARLYKFQTVANAMSELKNAALEASTVSVARNQHEKKCHDDEKRQRIENFRNNEGKGMHHAQRALKEAMIDQEDPADNHVKQKRASKPY